MKRWLVRSVITVVTCLLGTLASQCGKRVGIFNTSGAGQQQCFRVDYWTETHGNGFDYEKTQTAYVNAQGLASYLDPNSKLAYTSVSLADSTLCTTESRFSSIYSNRTGP